MECGGRRSATPLWSERTRPNQQKRRRRFAPPAHSIRWHIQDAPLADFLLTFCLYITEAGGYKQRNSIIAKGSVAVFRTSRQPHGSRFVNPNKSDYEITTPPPRQSLDGADCPGADRGLRKSHGLALGWILRAKRK